MTDFEDRLTGALRSAGDDAPDATGLAPAARRRAGVRRRRTALTSAAAVVAVVGVVGGVALLGDGDDEPRRSTDDPTPSSTPRRRRPHDGAGRVLARRLRSRCRRPWGHGSLSTWCIQAVASPARRSSSARAASVEDIVCTPEQGYGVRFFDGARSTPRVEAGQIWDVNSRGRRRDVPERALAGVTSAGATRCAGRRRRRATRPSRCWGPSSAITGVDANGCAAAPRGLDACGRSR